MIEHEHKHGGPDGPNWRRFRNRPRFPGPDFGPRRPGGFPEPDLDDEAEFGEHDGPGFHGHHGHHRHHTRPDFADRGFGPGGPGFGGPGPGFGPGFGPGGWGRAARRGKGRAKRGDVRAAALALLAEEPMNGYQIIQQISERSGGLWRPSPGSVYPALQQLEDEGLISNRPSESGRAAFELTDAGREYAATHADELRAPWSAMSGDGISAAIDVRSLVGQVHMAAFQVVSAGTQAQVTQACEVLAQTRRALYRILADDAVSDGDPGAPRDEADRPDPGAE